MNFHEKSKNTKSITVKKDRIIENLQEKLEQLKSKWRSNIQATKIKYELGIRDEVRFKSEKFKYIDIFNPKP